MSSKEEIKRQIAALQAKLAEVPESPPTKRQRINNAPLLAPSTPSPKKKAPAPQRCLLTRNSEQSRQTRPIPNPFPSHTTGKRSKHTDSMPTSSQSSFIERLKSLNADKDDDREPTTRTEGFQEKAPPSASGSKRDDRLAIVEDLVPGPAEHKPIADDPHFEKIEPNSGIKLRERILPHKSLQDHLSGRYYVPPSLLYSIIRLQPNKQAYEVPVEGDWVTISVVAERGDVKFTSGPGNSAHGKRPNHGEDDVFGKPESNKKRKKEEDEGEDTGRKGSKKYVHLKLVDLGHHSRSLASSSDRTRGSLQGDAQLSLLLFESDYFDKLIEKDGKQRKVRKLWRGGSGGAFEECFPGLREGTVIALLNPKVLKPFTNGKNSSPTSSILALTPPSASAIAVIGTAADLGRCTVLRRDGKPCGSWVDLRASGTSSGSKRTEAVCEYHVQAAVQRTRASRPEFSIGTSGMSTTAQRRKTTYDPARQYGLKPEGGSRGPDGETTYVINGFVASSGHVPALGNVSNTMGREEQARARRKAGAGEDRALAELLGKDNSSVSGGVGSASREALMVVQKARKVVSKAKDRATSDPKAGPKADVAVSSLEADDENQPRKKAYSAEMIQRLGFDPTIKSYGASKAPVRPKTSGLTSNLGKPGQTDREIHLGPPPGPKVRSGVTVAHLPTKGATQGIDDRTVEEARPGHLSNSLDKGAMGKLAKGYPFMHNGEAGSDSDSDLEIEPPPLREQAGAIPGDVS